MSKENVNSDIDNNMHQESLNDNNSKNNNSKNNNSTDNASVDINMDSNNKKSDNANIDSSEIDSKNISSTDKEENQKAKKEKKKLFKKKKTKDNSSDDNSLETTSIDESSKSDEEVEDDISDYKIDEDGNFVRKRKKKMRKKKDTRDPREINIVKELLNLIIYFAVVILAVFFILKYVGCKSLVNGPSMNPVLENNDYVWVDKISYKFVDPKRFDVIIFNYDENTKYVKRIIGLPGETVKIDQNGNIYINGNLMNEDYGLERIEPTRIGRASEPVLLGEDEYFVLGDNRNNSSDSRFADVGNISKDEIIGKVIFRLSPIKKIGVIR